MRMVQRFRTDERGTAAMMFGLAVLPLVAFAGAAIDYSRASSARTALQAAADATALQVVATREHGDAVDVGNLLKGAFVKRAAEGEPQATGGWTGAAPSSAYTVMASVSVPTTLFSIFVPAVEVSVKSRAEVARRYTRTQIEGFNMSPEAADYNELYAYCYDHASKRRLGPVDPSTVPGEGTKPEDGIRRLPFQKISDNSAAGVAANPANLSVICAPGEVASYHLRNVRFARLDTRRHGPEEVDHNRPCSQTRTTSAAFGETWRHYTDTTYPEDSELPRFNTCYAKLVETIVCTSRSACATRALGGDLPNSEEKNRDQPRTATRACAPGRFVYYGWEDRPPSLGGSDKDYDDIRLTVSCPRDIVTKGPARLTM